MRRLVAEGYRVATVFEAVMKSLAAELPQTPTYRYDIGQPAQVKARFAMIASDLGPVDVLIYNAGKGVWGTAEEVSLEAFPDRLWRTNTFGAYAAV